MPGLDGVGRILQLQGLNPQAGGPVVSFVKALGSSGPAEGSECSQGRWAEPSPGVWSAALGRAGAADGVAPPEPVDVVGAADASDAVGALWRGIAENHRRNRLLWAEEDLARRTRASDAEIVANKRAIDRHNQARNDAVERIDDQLLSLLRPISAPGEAAEPASPPRLHSETPGAMIDRLSILSLKIAAMRSRAADLALDATVRTQCAARVPTLERQRDDLASCLQTLLDDVAQGRARFELYRQFKMYNDPRLNPVLAAEAGRAPEGAPACGPAATPTPKTSAAATVAPATVSPRHPAPRPDVCQPTGSAELPMLDVYMPMMKSSAIVAAARLGLFEALADGPLDVAALASATRSDRQGVQALADFLVTVGYLVETDAAADAGPGEGSSPGSDSNPTPPPEVNRSFDLSDFARRWFTRSGQVDYTAGALWTHEAWSMMGALDVAVRQGKPEVSLWQRMQGEPHLGPLFSRYMHAFAHHLGPDLVARLPVTAQQTRLLDLGGSHGLHAIGLCRAHPQLSATVADWPASLTDTPAHIAEAGLAERIDTLPGDILRHEWVQPRGFDLILYLSVGHNQDDDGNARMLQAMARSLRPGGLIVVHDYLIGRPLNAFHAAFRLTLLFETGTRTWAEADYTRWAQAAGLSVRQRIDLDPIEKGSLLLIGHPAS